MNILSVKKTSLDPSTVRIIDEQGVESFANENHPEVLEWVANGGVIEDADPIVDLPFTIGADVPWDRMTEEEAELVQAGIDASPVKTRNMINKATSFMRDTDAFNKFKAITAAALDASRADEIMASLSNSELAALMESA